MSSPVDTSMNGNGMDSEFESWRNEAPPPLAPRVRDEVCAGCEPVRPLLPTWIRFSIAALVGIGTTVGVGLFARPAWSGLLPRGLPTWWWAVTLCIWVVCALVLTWMAVREADPTAPVRSRSRVAVVAFLALGFGGAAVATQALYGGGGDDVVVGLRCLTMGTVVELAPVLVILLLIARGAPFHPVRAGAIGGIAAGGWALAILQVRCPSTHAMHNLVFHLGVAALWGLIGSGVGLWLAHRKPRRPRRAEPRFS